MIIMSKPKSDAQYKKIIVSATDKGFFTEQFTEKQVIHKNMQKVNFYSIYRRLHWPICK